MHISLPHDRSCHRTSPHHAKPSNYLFGKMYDATSWYNVRIWCLTYLDYTNSTTWERKVGSEVHSKNISYLIWSQHVQQHRHIHMNSPQHNLTSNRFSNKIISPCWYFRLSGIITVFFQRCKVFNIFNLLKSSSWPNIKRDFKPPFGCERVKQWNPQKASGRKNELKLNMQNSTNMIYIYHISPKIVFQQKSKQFHQFHPSNSYPSPLKETPPAFFASGSPLLTVAPDLSTTVTAAEPHGFNGRLTAEGPQRLRCRLVLVIIGLQRDMRKKQRVFFLHRKEKKIGVSNKLLPLFWREVHKGYWKKYY